MRIADTPPIACSGCGGQYPDCRHVDFEAAWDGPVYEDPGVATGDGGTRTRLQVPVEDLFLCEDCLSAAAALLGFMGPKEAERLRSVQEANVRLEEELRGAKDYASKLESAVAVKPEPPRKARPKARA